MADHLDSETSVAVDVTPTGVTAKANSRFVAAADRLGGNLLELINAPLERRISRQRTLTEEETRVIKAVSQMGIERLQHDPQFAERAIGNHFQRLFEKQSNKDAVLIEALNDLREEPPTEIAAKSGPDQIDSTTLDRLERYAEDAGTEELRKKWGRVLAAEVRAPGTFTTKALRIVDELEKETAELFQAVTEHALENAVPKCLVGELEFRQLAQLVSADLIVDPGLTGHVRQFAEATASDGKTLWITSSEEHAVGFPKDPMPSIAGTAKSAVQLEAGRPCIPIYILTDAGCAVAKILPKNNAMDRYIEQLGCQLVGTKIMRFRLQPDNSWRRVDGPLESSGSAISN